MEKDYSLLRPFDLEAAKAGAELYWHADGQRAKYFGESDQLDRDICIQWLETKRTVIEGKFAMLNRGHFCMAPLCWVEGRPVYKGDMLYLKGNAVKFVAGSNAFEANEFLDAGLSYEDPRLTWTPPKVKREGWVNIYSAGGHERAPSALHKDKATADHEATEGRIACIRIEWEEPSAP